MELKLLPGKPYPLGANWDGKGVNFALYANHATNVDLCLFEGDDQAVETLRIPLRDRFDGVWHVYVRDLKPGQLYGYRINGTYDPKEGMRYNVAKLLIDPYAKAIAGKVIWNDALYGYEIGHPDQDLHPSSTDSAPFSPKSVVVDTHFNWGKDKPLNIPFHKTIIYEAHVKGFTYLNEQIPEKLRGTYAGIAHSSSINYLKQLGVTAIELLPVHHSVADQHLEERGLTNYWGYNTICFFAPDARFSSSGVQGEQVNEFKNMVKELHKAGIEVILDVVYNHSAEGNHLGPTLSFKGIDNSAYYTLVDDDKRYYMDYTGTGNTFNASNPNVLRMIMDSLRYWVTEMHVDGFRFDLAATLVRELKEAGRLNAFFDIIHQDPIISQVKLIAEPWDISETGYLVGKFPPEWAEWNDKYRDCMRDYWRGGSKLAEFASRLTGSSDLYENTNRQPTASINFITAHDGFTLLDLVSYDTKHNEANGDNNNDGNNDNYSWNCGAEGPTDDENIIKLRKRQQRNFLATMLLSQGVPMILSGDEVGHSQQGNNNAYCQDNEMTWLNWKKMDMELFQFTQALIQLRKKHPSLSRNRWFRGIKLTGGGMEEVTWFQPEGGPMQEEHWNNGGAQCVGVYVRGIEASNNDPLSEETCYENFYIIFNAHPEGVTFKLPTGNYGLYWKKIVDTNEPFIKANKKTYYAGERIVAEGRSVIVMRNESNAANSIKTDEKMS